MQIALRLAAVLLCVATWATAQTPTYYIEGLFRQGNAQLARNYLNISTNGTWTALTNNFLGIKIDRGEDYYAPTNNGVAAALNALTPTHAWGCLTISAPGTHITLPGANVYANVTNYDYIVTNSFYGARTTGILTNSMAGWYKIFVGLSAKPGNADQWELDLGTNGVNTDVIAAHSTGNTPANFDCVAATGIMWLPANTRLSIMVKNINAATMTIDHGQIVVTSP